MHCYIYVGNTNILVVQWQVILQTKLIISILQTSDNFCLKSSCSVLANILLWFVTYTSTPCGLWRVYSVDQQS